MLAQQVKRERRPPRDNRFPPPRQPPARSSQWQAKPVRFKQGVVPLFQLGVQSRCRPRGSLDLKAQTYHSRTRPSPRLDKGGASRESTRAWSLSELCSRRHSPPISLKRERCGGEMRRPALVPPSSESGHASHANQLRRQHQVRDRGFNQRVGLRRGVGGRWARPPPHTGTSLLFF